MFFWSGNPGHDKNMTLAACCIHGHKTRDAVVLKTKLKAFANRDELGASNYFDSRRRGKKTDLYFFATRAFNSIGNTLENTVNNRCAIFFVHHAFIKLQRP